MGDIRISGSGKINADGSYYDEVRVSGSGRIDGNLRCGAIAVSGSGHFEGSVNCEEDIRISGAGHFEGNVECGGLYVSGSVHIENDLKCNTFKSSGSSRINGSVNCTEAGVSGALHVEKDMSGEDISISGAADIKGLLNAENITLSLGGNYSIGEIGCTNLSVEENKNHRKFRFFSISFGSKNSGELVCPVIEGDEVNLVRTTSRVVRGKNVRIGPCCTIDRVEYSESIEVDQSAAVGERVKI